MYLFHNGKVNNVRDKMEENSISRRITLGYTQLQGDTHNGTEWYQEKKLPFASFPGYGKKKKRLTENLALKLSNILSLGQSILDTFYKNDQPMMEKERIKIFGLPFGKSFYGSCTARFGFVDLFLEKNSTVNRHIDYKNDMRQSYTYSTSYSYLIYREEDKLLYWSNIYNRCPS